MLELTLMGSGFNVCGEEEDTDEEEDSSQAPEEEGVARLTSPVTRLSRDSGHTLLPLLLVVVELGAAEGSRVKRPL